MLKALWIIFLAGIIAAGMALASGEKTHPWPKGEMQIYASKKNLWQDELLSAINFWNRVGLPVRLRLTENMKKQDTVQFLTSPADKIKNVCQGNCAGQASQNGYKAWGNSLVVRRAWKSTFAERKRVIVHELGHLLGLPHSDNVCSIMYSGDTSGCYASYLTSSDYLELGRLYPSWKPTDLQNSIAN